MPRRRMIDPSIWEDEDAGQLSDAAFRLWLCCISNADDDGKLLGAPARLKGLAFRFDSSVSTSDVERLLDEIDATMRSFVRYRVDGRDYIKLLTWHKYQSINRATASKLPDPSSSKLSEDSVNTHGVLTEHSLSTHGALTEHSLPKRKEVQEKYVPGTSGTKEIRNTVHGVAEAKKNGHDEPAATWATCVAEFVSLRAESSPSSELPAREKGKLAKLLQQHFQDAWGGPPACLKAIRRFFSEPADDYTAEHDWDSTSFIGWLRYQREATDAMPPGLMAGLASKMSFPRPQSEAR